VPSYRPERDSRLDALRGIAMLAVVLNHSLLAGEAALSASGGRVRWGLVSVGLGQVGVWIPPSVYEGLLLNVVVTVHLALFAFVGGYVTKVNTRATVFIVDRARRLLLPYVSWMVIAVAMVPSLRPAGWFGPMMDAAYNPHAPGALWFLPVYFVCLLLLWAVNAVGRGRVVVVWASVILMAALSLFPHAPVVRYMGDASWLYPFVALGFLAREGSLVLPKTPFQRWVVAVLLCGAGFYVSWPPLSSYREATILELAVHTGGRYAAALGGIAIVWILVSAMPNWLTVPLGGVGRRSLGVYAIHSLLLGPMILLEASWVICFAWALSGSLLITEALRRSVWLDVLLLGARPLKVERDE